MLRDTEFELSKLPAAPSDDAQGDVITLVSGFSRELAAYVEGTPDEDGIHQLIRPLNKTFLDNIWATAQPFFPFVSGSAKLFVHPTFPTSGAEGRIFSSLSDSICVDEVMDMADK
jgi:hypothetical protein